MWNEIASGAVRAAIRSSSTSSALSSTTRTFLDSYRSLTNTSHHATSFQFRNCHYPVLHHWERHYDILLLPMQWDRRKLQLHHQSIVETVLNPLSSQD